EWKDSGRESFHSKDYQGHSGLSLGQAQKALNVLHHMGAVDRTGKEGNMFIYQRRTRMVSDVGYGINTQEAGKRTGGSP
ncbi:MAG: hypothetical protein R6W96_04235, partial [Clostridia bacterium]